MDVDDVIDLDVDSFDSFTGGIEPPESDNKLQCRYCGKVFTRSNYRKEHERIHTGEKPHECGFCGQRFNSKGSCNKHERSHMNRATESVEYNAKWRPFSCHICQQSFTLESVLKKHILFHSGMKKYQCEVCKKSYFTSYDLRIHVRSHTGEKPYKCRVCNIFFTTGRRRNLHEKCHFRQDTLQCKKCKTIFRTVNSLKLHRYKTQLRGTGCVEPEDAYTVNNSFVSDDGHDSSTNETFKLDERESRAESTVIESQGTSDNDDSNRLVVNENIADQDDNSVELDIEVHGNQYQDDAVANEASLVSNILPSRKASRNIHKESQTQVAFPTGLYRSTEQGIEINHPLSYRKSSTKESAPEGIDIVDSSRISHVSKVSRYLDTRTISNGSSEGKSVDEMSIETDTEVVMTKPVDFRESSRMETSSCRLSATGLRPSRCTNGGPYKTAVVKMELTDDSNQKSVSCENMGISPKLQVLTSATDVLDAGSTEGIASLAKQRVENVRMSNSSSLQISNAAIRPVASPRIIKVVSVRKGSVSSPSSSSIDNAVAVYKSVTPQLVKTSVNVDRNQREHCLSKSDTLFTSEFTVVSSSAKYTQTRTIDDTDILFAEMESARKVFECKHCSIMFRDYTMYLVHKTLHIDTRPPFVCHLCGNEARDKVDFNSHLVWHMNK